MSEHRMYASEKCDSNHTGAVERSVQTCALALMAAKTGCWSKVARRGL